MLVAIITLILFSPEKNNGLLKKIIGVSEKDTIGYGERQWGENSPLFATNDASQQ